MLRTAAIALFAAALFASNAEAAKMTVAAGYYPWHEYKNNHERAWTACYPNESDARVWKKFESRLGVWNWGDEWSEERFRRMSVGDVLEIPPTECELAAKDAEIAKIKRETADAMKRANDRFADEKRLLQEQIDELSKRYWSTDWRTWALALLLAATIAFALLQRRNAKKVVEIPATTFVVDGTEYDRQKIHDLRVRSSGLEEELARANAKLSEYDKLVRRDYYEYELKRGLRRVSSLDETVFLQRVDTEHVRLPWESLPVKITSLDERFAEATPDELRLVDVERERVASDRTRRIPVRRD